jgi:hypothetical protein
VFDIRFGPYVECVRKCGHLARRGANELAEPPRPRIEAARIVDMTSSNAWAEFAGIFCQTRAGTLGCTAAAH